LILCGLLGKPDKYGTLVNNVHNSITIAIALLYVMPWLKIKELPLNFWMSVKKYKKTFTSIHQG
jgi:hypothetical protein